MQATGRTFLGAAATAAQRQGKDLGKPYNKLREVNAARRPAGVPRPPHLDATSELKELGLIA